VSIQINPALVIVDSGYQKLPVSDSCANPEKASVALAGTSRPDTEWIFIGFGSTRQVESPQGDHPAGEDQT